MATLGAAFPDGESVHAVAYHPKEVSMDATQPFSELPAASVRQAVPVTLAEHGEVVLSVFEGLVDGRTDHLSLAFQGPDDAIPLVRVHSECVTGDVFGSLRCDCGPQLKEALSRCRDEGGIILYLRQEGRGIGLADKIVSYYLQDRGFDTFTANRELGFTNDMRDYGVAAQMLKALGHTTIKLLTNNPDKKSQLEHFGIKIVSCEPTSLNVSEHNLRYLMAKRDAGHALAIKPLSRSSDDNEFNSACRWP